MSYVSLEVALPEGVTVIVGPNGVGKSSFVDAIAFALTGSAVSRKASSKGELITHGASESSVTLELEVNNKIYEVKRTISKRGASQALLREEGSLRAIGVQNVDKVIANILGFDGPKVLREIVFVPQGKLTELIELRPSELKNRILELVGLKDKETIDKALREAISYYRGASRSLQRVVEEYKELEAELRKGERELKSILEKLPAVERQLASASEELEEKKAEVEKLRELRTKYHETLRRTKELEREVKSLEEELAKLTDVSPETLSSLREKEKEIRALEEERKELEAKKELIVKKMKYLKKLDILRNKLSSLPELEEELSGLEERLEDVEKELNEMKNKLWELKSIQKERTKELEQLERVKNKLKRLIGEASLEDAEEKLERLEKEIEGIEEELETLKSKLAELETKKKEKEEALKLLRGKDKCPVCGAPLTPAKRRELEREYRDEITELSKKIAVIRRKVRDLEEKLSLKRKLRDALLNKVNAARSALESVGFEDAVALELNLSTLKNDLMKINKERAQLESEIQRLEKEKFSIEQKVKELRKRVSELNRAKGELETVEGVLVELKDVDVDELEKVEDALKGTERKLKELGSLEELERTMREVEEALKKKNELEGELRAKIKELAREREELARLKYDEAEHLRLEKELKELEERVRKLQNERAELEARANSLRSEIDKARSKLSMKKKEIEELRAYDEFSMFLEDFRKTFNTRIVDVITESFRREWEEVSNEILKYFELNVSSIRIVETKEGRQRGWLVRALTPAGDEVDVGSLSGGERVGIALALKLGLAKILSRGKLSFLILDEPTIYLDSERRQALRQILSNAVGPSLTQLFVVTHDREMIDIADNACTVERGPRGSRIVCSNS